MIDFADCADASPELNFQWSGNRCRIMPVSSPVR